MYLAYLTRYEGDLVGAHQALDSAWQAAATDFGRAAIDSVRVSEFGLEPVAEAPISVPDTINR